jgi:hypothetical protein
MPKELSLNPTTMQNWAGKRRGKQMVAMNRVVKQLEWVTDDRAE